jgi:mannose/fructose/N-acetylgalactosamine-specific phosphotransferase system component IIC
MIAQPMVCGPFFGWLTGQLAIGVIIGGVVQLLWLDVTPVGVGIPYDATAVTILAVYWATLTPNAGLHEMIVALFLAVPFGVLFKWMDFYARRLNSVIMRKIESVPDERLPAAIPLGIAASFGWSWVRYAVSYLAAMAAGRALMPHLLRWSHSNAILDTGLVLAGILIPIAGLGVALELFLSEDPEGRLVSWRPLRTKPRNPS